MENRIDTPRVFISYSWSSPKHEEWVIDFAEKLRSDGVDVIFDKWDLQAGHDKYAFMEKMVTDPNIKKVLIICDEQYAQKADQKKGGVGTESQIISGKIYKQVDQEKFIPIAKEKDKKGEPYLPVFIESRIFIDLSSDEIYNDEYQNLLRNLYGRPALKKPPLGTPPSYIKADKAITLQTGHKFSQFKNAINNDHLSTGAFAKDYLETLFLALDDFKLDTREKPETGYDDKIMESIENFKTYLEEYCEFIRLISINPSSKETYEEIFEFFEKAASYLFLRDVGGSQYDIWLNNFNYILRELFIYLIAILIKHKKYEWVRFFTSEKYYYSTPNGKKASNYALFERYNETLDEHRKNRLKLNRSSIVADLIKERCDIEKISFEEIMQTDFILFVRSLMLDQRNWYPRTLVYLDSNSGPFDLFFKAQSKRHFEGVKTLLDIKGSANLINFFKKARQDGSLDHYRIGYHPIPFHTLLNLDNLDKE